MLSSTLVNIVPGLCSGFNRLVFGNFPEETGIISNLHTALTIPYNGIMVRVSTFAEGFSRGHQIFLTAYDVRTEKIEFLVLSLGSQFMEDGITHTFGHKMLTSHDVENIMLMLGSYLNLNPT